LKPEFTTHFRAGIAHFNAREFWEAHESWETLWLAAESDVEQYLQGLIQIAAAYHHVKRGTYRGAVRLFDAALRRLEPFPMDFCGVDRTDADAAARRHRDWVASLLEREALDERLPQDEYPRLHEGAVSPPSSDW
jgi:predicted metal-dependent hydrolase